MLLYLRIQNFALIESLELELSKGLTVLTGETGAGKSIILAAVNLLLGGRAAVDLIRHGADQAVVEAQFSLPPASPLWLRLKDSNLVRDEEEGVLNVRRVVSREGRNRVHINGALSSLQTLDDFMPDLMSICGQHAHQSLLKPEEHLSLLDCFAGLEEKAGSVARAVDQVFQLDQQINDLHKALANRQERKVWLEHMISELEEAELAPDEEQELKDERRLLANADQIARLAGQAYEGLYGAEEGSALEILGRVRGILSELARLDSRGEAWHGRLEEAYFNLDDLAQELRSQADNVLQDPQRLDWLENRLLTLQRLGRKYGGSVEEALSRLAQARQELSQLSGGEEQLVRLQKQRDEALSQALRQASALSRQRRAKAPELAQRVEKELKGLGMAHCEFEMRFSPAAGPALHTEQGPLSRLGLEQGEFYMAPNPGEGFHKLTRIASGGELSRLMLALRGVVALDAGIATLIFDEVDAGIGGAVGGEVGRKLAELALHSQVICITHLPQIAAYGAVHLTVQKQVKDQRTVTVLQTLSKDEHVAELARMLSGAMGGKAALEHALALQRAAKESSNRLFK